jgi:RHS repeat-associated protein
VHDLVAVTDAHLSVSPVTQCYGYNGLNRLDEAWTITGTGTSCATSFATQDPETLDTSATKYSSGWEYSDAGRVTLVTNLLDSSTRTYDYDTVHPAAVIEVEKADSTPTVTGTDTFTYDDVGRMVSRETATGEMTLTWDVSSNLVKTVEDDETVLYVYDGSGQRVARIGATTATAYLGSVEVTDLNTDSGVTGDLQATRFYTLGGATVATRTATSLSFLFGDHQGSAEVMVTHPIGQDDTLDLVTPPTVTRNAYTPYGTTRDTDQLSIDHGWLNQISDETDTGLIYLNARYYDPILSRFLSPDPLMDPTDPKTLDPYMYAANNPIAFQDTSGLWYCPPGAFYQACIDANNHPVNPSTGPTPSQMAPAANQNAAQTSNSTKPSSLGLPTYVYGGSTYDGPANEQVITDPGDWCHVGQPVGTSGACGLVQSGEAFDPNDVLDNGRLSAALDGLDEYATTLGATQQMTKGGLSAATVQVQPYMRNGKLVLGYTRWAPGTAEAGQEVFGSADGATKVVKLAGRLVIVADVAITGLDSWARSGGMDWEGRITYTALRTTTVVGGGFLGGALSAAGMSLITGNPFVIAAAFVVGGVVSSKGLEKAFDAIWEPHVEPAN